MSKNVDIYLLTVYCILYILIIVKGQTNRNIRTQSWESKVGNVGVRGLIRYDSSAAENTFLQSFFVRR